MITSFGTFSAKADVLTWISPVQASKTDPTSPSLRLANLTKLSHNLSVDIYCEQIICFAKLVIIRVIGGVSYWAYGLEQIRNKVNQVGAKLAVVPGDDKSDTQLMSYSTISKDAVDRIWAYFINGGVDNALNLIKYAGYLLGQEGSWKEPAPLLKAGLYWPLLPVSYTHLTLPTN